MSKQLKVTIFKDNDTSVEPLVLDLKENQLTILMVDSVDPLKNAPKEIAELMDSLVNEEVYPKGCAVIVADKNVMGIERKVFDEKQMNSLGWYRKEEADD